MCAEPKAPRQLVKEKEVELFPLFQLVVAVTMLLVVIALLLIIVGVLRDFR